MLVAAFAPVVVVRAASADRAVHRDLGPGPVRGVRLTEFVPGEGDLACAGVTADQPVVRLVEQVNVESVTICLGPGRLSATLPVEPYVLMASESAEAERLLDTWSAAWSLPDRRLRWWQSQDRIACDASPVLLPAVSITVAGVAMRPVPPSDRCHPLDPAVEVMGELSQAARLTR